MAATTNVTEVPWQIRYPLGYLRSINNASFNRILAESFLTGESLWGGRGGPQQKLQACIISFTQWQYVGVHWNLLSAFLTVLGLCRPTFQKEKQFISHGHADGLVGHNQHILCNRLGNRANCFCQSQHLPIWYGSWKYGLRERYCSVIHRITSIDGVRAIDCRHFDGLYLHHVHPERHWFFFLPRHGDAPSSGKEIDGYFAGLCFFLSGI